MHEPRPEKISKKELLNNEYKIRLARIRELERRIENLNEAIEDNDKAHIISYLVAQRVLMGDIFAIIGSFGDQEVNESALLAHQKSIDRLNREIDKILTKCLNTQNNTQQANTQ